MPLAEEPLCVAVPEWHPLAEHERVELAALQGGDAVQNAAIARELFAGAPGPVRDAVLLNAAGAIVAFEQTGPLTDEGLADAMRDAMGRAAAVIDSGDATRLLDRWAALSTELAGTR